MRTEIVQPQGSTSTLGNKQAIARIFNIKESTVLYSVTGIAIDNAYILYDEVTETSWWNTGTGTITSSTISDNTNTVVTSTNTFVLYPAIAGTAINWVYNSGSATGGETTLTPPMTFTGVSSIYINGLRQSNGYSFSVAQGEITLATALTKGDFVEVILNVNPDQLMNVFSGTDGASKIGASNGKTVQGNIDTLNDITDGNFDTSKNKNFYDKIKNNGQFGIDEIPGEVKGIAAITFGNPDTEGNKGTITVDERGRIQVFSIVKGKLTATKVAVPFTQGTGFFNNQFEDRVVRFPCAGQEDDDLSPGLLLTWDKTLRKYKLGVMSPFMSGNTGYPNGGINDQMNLLAGYYDVGYGLNHSFDHFNTSDLTTDRYGKVCTISSGSSGGSVKKFSALLTSGDYVDYEQATFLIEVNGQNLVATAKAGNIDQSNLSKWVKLTRISESTNGLVTQNEIPEIGIVYNSTNGNVEVWLKMPKYSPCPSITVLSLDNPSYVTIDWTDWAALNLPTTVPTGLITSYTLNSLGSLNYVMVNSGGLSFTPKRHLKVKDTMTSSSTSNRMTEFLSYGYIAGDSYTAINKTSSSSTSLPTVTKNSTGNYTVTNCTITNVGWKVKPPKGWWTGADVGVIAITSSATGTFTFTLTDSSGKAIDIPDGTWVDFHVY